jgi:REP element-mobilizing transposase RayT
MSLPRRIRPGSIWLVTRRCAGRQFLLRPDRFVNDVLLYCLGHAAKKTGVQIHAFQFLSNHYHLVVSDPNGVLPDFLHLFDSLVARILNRYRGRRENFWSCEHYSAVELLDDEAVVEKIIYTLTNVVAAGLVHKHDAWPGLTSTVDRIEGDEYVVRRPKDGFFRRTTLPEEVRLRLTRPPCFRGQWLAKLRDRLETLVREREKEIRARFRREGREFLSRARVLEQDPTSAATSPEAFGARVPAVACKDPERRREEIRLLREFRHAHRKARDRFAKGERKVQFPHGTWLLRVHFHVRCAEAPV